MTKTRMTTMISRKSYSELISIKSYKDRYDYLKIDGAIGKATFGGHRYLNQVFYRSLKWKDIRKKVIIRDNACDLAHKDYEILGRVYIHHINPITIEDMLEERSCVYDLENLVCVSFDTHNAIHFGSEGCPTFEPIERKRYDTCPWR